MDRETLITAEEAFQALVEFLVAYYERGADEGIATLLGGLGPAGDGGPRDPALMGDWLEAVEQIVVGRREH